MSGTIPTELAASHSLISFDVRFNPLLCGTLPPDLKVDWDWQWTHSEAVEQARGDWVLLSPTATRC